MASAGHASEAYLRGEIRSGFRGGDVAGRTQVDPRCAIAHAGEDVTDVTDVTIAHAGEDVTVVTDVTIAHAGE